MLGTPEANRIVLENRYEVRRLYLMLDVVEAAKAVVRAKRRLDDAQPEQQSRRRRWLDRRLRELGRVTKPFEIAPTRPLGV